MHAEYAPFFHVGALVRDIDQAAADFAEILGLRFEPVRSAPLVSGEVMRFCYSLQGPPYLELVQMAETSVGLWAPSRARGCTISPSLTTTCLAGAPPSAARPTPSCRARTARRG